MLTSQPKLLHLLAAGDGLTWERFISNYKPAMIALARTFLGRDDAEDVIQDVLVKVFSYAKSPNYDPEYGKFRTWLRKVTANTITDRLRNKKDRWRSLSDSQLQELVQKEEPTFDRNFDARTLQDALAQVKAQVDGAQWQAFFLTTITETPLANGDTEISLSKSCLPGSIEQVKEQLGCEKSTVYAYRKAVFELLGKELGVMGYGDE